MDPFLYLANIMGRPMGSFNSCCRCWRISSISAGVSRRVHSLNGRSQILSRILWVTSLASPTSLSLVEETAGRLGNFSLSLALHSSRMGEAPNWNILGSLGQGLSTPVRLGNVSLCGSTDKTTLALKTCATIVSLGRALPESGRIILLWVLANGTRPSPLQHICPD